MMELLGLILIISTMTLLILWMKQYADQEYYLSGYYPLLTTLALIANSILKCPMQIRIERVLLWSQTKKARKKQAIPRNTNPEYNWSKTSLVGFALMVSIMLTCLYFIDTIIPTTGQFSSIVPTLKILGWTSVIISVLTGASAFICTTPSINHPQWMKKIA
jgi:hypothetical protein